MVAVSSANIKPLADRVLVRPQEREERTKGGIVLPDTAKEKPQMGKVLAVGPGRLLESGQRVAMEVKEGDTILFSKYAGTEIKVDGEELLLINERDILAIVEG
ncbi:MAG TPA: co-chaperone GroES [Symbiobacteriaceae bacterium]